MFNRLMMHCPDGGHLFWLMSSLQKQGALERDSVMHETILRNARVDGND